MTYKWIYETPDPFDDILLNSDGKSLTGLWFAGSRDACKHQTDCPAKSLPIFNETCHWLDLYFAGQPPDFTPKYSLGRLSPFRKQVFAILATIPFGQTMTYYEMAEVIARERNIPKMSPQAIGGAVGANPIGIILPCHRVIGKNGAMVGYGGGVNNKIALLKHEGIILD